MEDEEHKLVQGRRNLVGNEEPRSSKVELTVDEVVEGYVGSLGLSQMLHVFLVSLAWIFDSQSTLVTIFSDAKPPAWRCKTELCQTSANSVCDLVPGTWEWVNGHTSSTLAEWNLICDRKFLAAIPASLFFLGSLLGSAVYGRLGDSWLGRRRTVLVACLLTSITAFLTSLSPNVWAYAFLRFANGFARSGIGICCLVLSTESVGRKWRGQVGQNGFFFFTAGFLSLPFIAQSFRTCWRNLYKFLSLLPLSYSILLLPFVSESPRWLLIRGRSKDALAVLQRFATLNGRKLPENISLANPSGDKISENESKAHENESLWATRWAAMRMAIIMIAGFGVGLVYYGIQLNIENLNFNLYISVALNALIEIPTIFIGSFLLGITNRRLLFSVSNYVAGLACILCVLFSNIGGRSGQGGNWYQLIIEAIGFMGASTAFDVLYIYCIELFPTNVRNFAVSMLRQALMLGASMAPLLVVLGRLNPSLPFLVFGGFSVCSGLFSIWLPETRNAPLYETLKQQEDEERKQSQVTHDSGLELAN